MQKKQMSIENGGISHSEHISHKIKKVNTMESDIFQSEIRQQFSHTDQRESIPEKEEEEQINFEQKQHKSDKQKLEEAIRNSAIAWNFQSRSPQEKQKLINLEEEQLIQKELKIDRQSIQTDLLELNSIKHQISKQEENYSKTVQKNAKESNSNLSNTSKKQEVELHGILFKQAPGIFGSWDQRYCILTQSKFIYKEDQNQKSKNGGILNFNLLSAEIEVSLTGETYTYFKINIYSCDKTFYFKGAHSEETKKWAGRLKIAIEKSTGWKQKLDYLAHYPRFWRKDYISEHQFRETAETGDILLFRGNKETAVLQRALTRDEFDHNGVILLNARRQILIFEANGGFGVGLCPWRKFIEKKWYQSLDLVVFKKLRINRSEAFLEEIQRFTEKNIGKKYNFSVKDFLFERSSTIENSKQTYNCASLVAKLYKTIEIIDKKKSSSQYVPSSWSDSGDLKLRKDGKYGEAYFEEERIIVFDQKLLSQNK